MSAVGSLSATYGTFFCNSALFAVSPYTRTFKSIASDNQKNSISGAFAAFFAISTLTFVVPVLPALCAITFSLASIAMLISTAAYVASLPFALIADAVTGEVPGYQPVV